MSGVAKLYGVRDTESGGIGRRFIAVSVGVLSLRE